MSRFDFFDLDVFARGTPHDQLRDLRETAPISWHAMPAPQQDQGFWLVSRHRDICEVARQPKIFLSHGGSVLTDANTIDHPAWRMVRDGLCHLDAPRHTELRRMVLPRFGAEAIDLLEGRVGAIVRTILDRAETCTHLDLVPAVADELPVRVVYQEVLGFEDSMLAHAAHWGDVLNRVHAIPNGDREFAPMMRSAGQVLDHLYRHAVASFDERRKRPRRDLLSVLAAMTGGGGEPISQSEYLSYFWSLATGAYDTTATTIAAGIAALAAHPEQQDMLYQRPELIDSAVEEMLRWESAVVYFRRTAAAPYVLGGQQINAGERVVMCFAAGNRDPEVFERPEVFDIERSHNPHLAFGHGAHFCLGARLARMELRVLFQEMIRRGLRFTPTEPPARVRSNFINRIVRMPVAVTLAPDLETMSFD